VTTSLLSIWVPVDVFCHGQKRDYLSHVSQRREARLKNQESMKCATYLKTVYGLFQYNDRETDLQTACSADEARSICSLHEMTATLITAQVKHTLNSPLYADDTWQRMSHEMHYMTHDLSAIIVITDLTSSSAMAERPRDALVSTNPADTRWRHIPRLA